MYKFKIDKIVVNSTKGVQSIIPKGINVIVGPNNSGKSRLLKELRDYLAGDHQDLKILKNVEFPYPDSFEEINDSYDIESKMVQDPYGNWMLKVYTNKPNQSLDMTASLESYFTRNVNAIGGNWKDTLTNVIYQNDDASFLNSFGDLFYQYIGTEERLTICKKQRNYGMDSNSSNYLSSFKYNDELLRSLADKVQKLFKKDIYLDAQTLGDRLLFRVGENFDNVRNKPISNKSEARSLFAEDALDNQGDGLKSFVSTFLSLNYGNNDVLLLDEPEAFLHPPLARQLGEMIGESQNESKTVFVATHSVEILKGILSKCKNVSVIRITQPEPHKNEIKLVNQDVLNTILQNPLLRVSRVLEGVFCDRVIITEAESDELVYQELIEKIFPESGLFFAHGQNKQTLATIARLYQKIGVKHEIITDFDVLRKTDELSQFLRLMPITEREQQKFESHATKLREIINNSVPQKGIEKERLKAIQKEKRNQVYHREGIYFFDKKEQKLIINSLNELSSFHLHILPTGELETILIDFGIKYQEKSKWIISAIDIISKIEKFESTSMLYQFLDKVVNGLGASINTN